MTDLELKQVCANMAPQQLLNLLRAVETANNKVVPTAKEYLGLVHKKKENEKYQTSSKGTQRGSLIAAIVSAVLGIIFLIMSGNVGKFSGFFCKLFGFGGLLIAVITVAMIISEKRSTKRLKAEEEELNASIAAAQQKLEQLKAENAIDLQIRQVICPAECAEPKYMRTFVSYFENGRASSLKEAYALFDELLHRERMEGYAQEQVQAARAAEYAAQSAANAANQAAVNASQAKSSADWAAYWTRFKD